MQGSGNTSRRKMFLKMFGNKILPKPKDYNYTKPQHWYILILPLYRFFSLPGYD